MSTVKKNKKTFETIGFEMLSGRFIIRPSGVAPSEWVAQPASISSTGPLVVFSDFGATFQFIFTYLLFFFKEEKEEDQSFDFFYPISLLFCLCQGFFEILRT